MRPGVRLRPAMAPWLRWLTLWVFALWCLFPLYWLVTKSLKRQVDAIARRARFLFTPIWDNYLSILSKGEV